jgi:protein-tyrosine phosphatase
MKRVTRLDGVHNFRRFGGYAAEGGAKVRDSLYRSGHFSRASDADQAHIGGLDIAVVADLRRPPERRREPSPWAAEHESPKAGPRVIDSHHGDEAEPPHLRFLREGDLSEEAVRGFMMSAYRRIPTEEGNQSVFREGVKALAAGEADSGFIVHCAAGKDRTGVFCALVLGELGVAPDEILADYLMTNHAVDFDAIIPGFQQRLKDEYGHDVTAEAMRSFMGVREEYLAETFRTIGGGRAYLTETLGVTPNEIEALRARWLTS